MVTPRRRKDKNERFLGPVHPNLGLELEYRRKMERLVLEMQKSVLFHVEQAYKRNTPRIASDEAPADLLSQIMKRLAARWLKRFNTAAPKLAQWFSQSVNQRSSARLRKILKDGGFTVEFKMTAAMRDIMNATINQNVDLIKSIPVQYFEQVQGLVMRSVQTGRDVGFLTKELKARYPITHRRAILIARAQNNMATSAMTRARQTEVGITEAVWVHSHGGNEPRPSHAEAGRKGTRYNIHEGWWDPDEKRFIWPGELINCRCVSKAVIKGFSWMPKFAQDDDREFKRDPVGRFAATNNGLGRASKAQQKEDEEYQQKLDAKRAAHPSHAIKKELEGMGFSQRGNNPFIVSKGKHSIGLENPKSSDKPRWNYAVEGGGNGPSGRGEGMESLKAHMEKVDALFKKKKEDAAAKRAAKKVTTAKDSKHPSWWK